MCYIRAFLCGFVFLINANTSFPRCFLNWSHKIDKSFKSYLLRFIIQHEKNTILCLVVSVVVSRGTWALSRNWENFPCSNFRSFYRGSLIKLPKSLCSNDVRNDALCIFVVARALWLHTRGTRNYLNSCLKRTMSRNVLASSWICTVSGVFLYDDKNLHTLRDQCTVKFIVE